MNRAGRKPMGPALVQNLDGSELAKQRLEVILETITGRLTIDQACERLAIRPSRFFKLRTEVLEASLKHLEPRPIGRPAHVQTAEEAKCDQLQEEVEQLQAELKLSAVRDEIVRTMPHLSEDRLSPRERRLKKTKSVKKKPKSVAGSGNGDNRQQRYDEQQTDSGPT